MSEELRSLCLRHRPKSAREGYPLWLRQEARPILQDALAKGRSYRELADDIGISAATVRRWTTAQPDASAGFRAVAYVPAADPQESAQTFRIASKAGLVVEDLELADVITILRALS